MKNIMYTDFYSETINHLTLKRAIDLHYEINPQFQKFGTYKTQIANSLIKAHDITHIIFGCNTGYDEEIRVQFWAQHGVIFNVAQKDKLKYLFDKEALELLLPKGIFKYTLTRFSQMKREQKRVKEQAKLMTKKWEYFKEDRFMDITVGEIREEYGIAILPHDIDTHFRP
ncbi:MAG: hypothetical protein ACK481_06480 [Candidatus Melainabacteria bacterium]|jgi:hypothetical protein